MAIDGRVGSTALEAVDQEDNKTARACQLTTMTDKAALTLCRGRLTRPFSHLFLLAFAFAEEQAVDNEHQQACQHTMKVN